jgi:predicted O-methyltransferase YrrM
MNFLSEDIEQYVEEHTSQENSLLRKINRETHARVLMPRMLSGHLQGRILAMFSHMLRPSSILEIGTYTGYSAVCLCEGLAEGGTLTTIDINEELEDQVREYFEEAGLTSSINYLIGDARSLLETIEIEPELVFIDADKQSYSLYYDMIIDRVPTGGYVIADNVLWSGKVASDAQDKDTENMREFNDKIHADPRVENILIPVRDGLLVMRKL